MSPHCPLSTSLSRWSTDKEACDSYFQNMDYVISIFCILISDTQMAMHTGRETWKASATKSTQYTGVIRVICSKSTSSALVLDWTRHWHDVVIALVITCNGLGWLLVKQTFCQGLLRKYSVSLSPRAPPLPRPVWSLAGVRPEAEYLPYDNLILHTLRTWWLTHLTVTRPNGFHIKPGLTELSSWLQWPWLQTWPRPDFTLTQSL